MDDEPKEAGGVSAVIKEYAAANHISLAVRIFASGEELLESYHRYAYTAIFMDIYMEGMTGVEAAEKIRSLDRDALIVFLTSSDEHMPEAFSLHAYDYVGKPAKKERLFRLLDDILMRVTEKADAPRLSFRDGTGETGVPLPDIIAVRTSKPNYLDITVSDGKEYHARMTFSEASGILLSDSRFLPIMRGVIVNMAFITRLEQGSCSLEGGLHFPVNVKNEETLKTTWQNYKIDCIRKERERRRSR